MLIGLRAEFKYFLCGSCGCLQITEVPRDLSIYYPADYYSLAPRVCRPLFRGRRLLRRLLSQVHLSAPPSTAFILRRLAQREPFFDWLHLLRKGLDSRMLDVGCGTGELLLLMHEAGFSDLTGVDPFVPAQSDLAPGLRILKGGVEAAKGRFDLIMLNHSFEHMPRPLEILQSLKGILAADGAVLIRIPIADSLAWRKYREHWIQLDAPRHLFLHSIRSMRQLASSAGFAVGDIVYDSHAMQFWGSEQYAKDIPLTDPRSYYVNPGNSMFSESEIKAFEVESSRLNREGQGDQACFYLTPSVP